MSDQREAKPDAPPACATCRVPVTDTYYTRGAETLCERCYHVARDAGPPGSPPTRMLGAIGFGLVAAVLAGGLWLLVAELTGYEIGLIAIVVGFLVGTAVHIGSRQIGGVPYQLLAVLLTYSAIVTTYVPTIVTELLVNEEFNSQIEAARAESEAAGLVVEVEPVDVAPGEEAATAAEADRMAVGITAFLIAIPLAYAAPFLMGFENLIGLLIIGFALFQAWKMNARANSELRGPFRPGDAAA